MWKNQGFSLAVLYWTLDGTARDSGQWTEGLSSGGQWTVDKWTSGQWTVDRRTVQYGTMGHWTGHPVLDNGTLDGLSCTGQWTLDKWTVDGTEWTEALSLL